MKLPLTKVCLLLFMAFMCLVGEGQERRIAEKNVSPEIRDYLKKQYPAHKRLHFYQETEAGDVFIEAEFRHENKKYSLRFQEDKLIETEHYLAFNQIPSDAQKEMTRVMDRLFTNYKILEVQVVNPHADALYELRIKGKSAHSRAQHVLYFDKHGQFIREEEIFSAPIPSQF